MDAIHYKLADISDLDALIKVGDDLFDYKIKPDRAIEFLDDKHHHLYLAYSGSNIVGMTSALDYVHPDKNPEMFILEAAVLESFQNRGIGRTLISCMVEHGKEIGCSQIWVATEQSNIAARKAYLAAGAIEDPERCVLFTF